MGDTDPPTRTSLVTADMHGMLAIRMGVRKLIENSLPEELPEERRKRIKMPLELQIYKLSDDPAESHNAYDQHPEIVKMLAVELARIRTQESSR